MSYIDTHSHLYEEYYPHHFDEVVERANAANVTTILLPCVSSETLQHLFKAANKYPNNLFPMIGLHPTDVTQNYRKELTLLEKYLNDDGMVAVGEIGIDLYHDKTFIKEQHDAFEIQLGWAKELDLPISIHVRDGFQEAISVIKKFSGSPFSGVFHCFSGGIQEAKWVIDNGFLLGVSGVITFKKNKLQDIVKEVGLEHIVLETDAPFLAPEPYRGKPNESSYIPFIAQKIASLFEITTEEVMEITTANARRIFKKLP
jgi:TatD DNase family protein